MVDRRGRLPEEAEHDPDGGQGRRGECAVADEPLPELVEDEKSGDDGQAEEGVAENQEGLPGLPCREVRHQRGTGRRRDHRRNDWHQPPTGGAVVGDLVAGDRPVGHRDRGPQTEQRARCPQDGRQRDRRAGPEYALADPDRTGTDGHQRHRRGSVEVGHHRVVVVAAQQRGILSEADQHRRHRGHQQETRHQPERQRDRHRSRHAEGKTGKDDGDDAGAHGGGVPVRTVREAHVSMLGAAAERR